MLRHRTDATIHHPRPLTVATRFPLVLDGYAQVKADEAMGSGTSFFEHKSGSRGSGGDENGSYFERQKVFIGVLLYLLVGGTVLAGPWADSGACPADGMAGAGELTVTNTTSADPDAARGVNMPAPVRTATDAAQPSPTPPFTRSANPTPTGLPRI